MWFFDKIISLTGSDPSSFGSEGFKVLVACVILVAAAALVIFPLMKIVRFIRTICRVFSGPRCDRNSKLTDEQLRVLTIGNLYAYQQGGWLNSLYLHIDTSRFNNIMHEWWGIYSQADAISTLQYLLQGTFSITFEDVCNAYALHDSAKAASYLKQHIENEDLRERATHQLENLNKCYNDLVRDGIVQDEASMRKLGVMGWDAGRLNFVARACYCAGYIEEPELWQLLQRAYDMAHSELHSWRELANSYMLGRTLWGGNCDMAGLADDLLTKPASPWTRLPW
ncbi:MAG: DUF1266 domain-containing protein [Bacteroides sp.]